MSFEDWLEETDREIAELKKRNEAKMAKTLAEAKLRNEEDARMKQEQFKKMQKRYNFSIEDERIQIALERLEGLAVDRFRNDDLLWSSFFVTLVAKKYRLATMLPFVPRMVCDSR